MKTVKIYTAGKMGGLPYNEQIKWRLELRRKLFHLVDWERCNVNVQFVHPPLYYSYDRPESYQTLHEVKAWDLTQLSTCDIMVVNLDEIESSVGTCMEIGFVDALNFSQPKKIFVIGIGNPTGLNPWIIDSMFRIEKSIDDAVVYINDFLLI